MRPRNELWQPAEDAILIASWREGGIHAAVRALPTRSYASIKMRAHRLREAGMLGACKVSQRFVRDCPSDRSLPRFDSRALLHRLAERGIRRPAC